MRKVLITLGILLLNIIPGYSSFKEELINQIKNCAWNSKTINVEFLENKNLKGENIHIDSTARLYDYRRDTIIIDTIFNFEEYYNYSIPSSRKIKIYSVKKHKNFSTPMNEYSFTVDDPDYIIYAHRKSMKNIKYLSEDGIKKCKISKT